MAGAGVLLGRKAAPTAWRRTSGWGRARGFNCVRARVRVMVRVRARARVRVRVRVRVREGT